MQTGFRFSLDNHPCPITHETRNFINEKEVQVNKILNKDGFYLMPKNCQRAGGCTCKILIILTARFNLTEQKEHQNNLVVLYPVSRRASSKSWGEIELKSATISESPKTKFEHGQIIQIGSSTVKNVEIEEDPIFTFAHETGHLFGFPDEYFINGGAVHKMYISPETQKINVTMEEPQHDWKRYAMGNLMSTPEYGKLPQIHAYYYR